MFLPGFRDLVKPQWVMTLEQLKLSGGLPVSELSRRLDASYMAAKQYCEDLKELGYLERSRLPRTEVGRPEILYRLTEKADALFPQAGVIFTLELLEQVKALFGENAPERLIFQYFHHQQEKWQPKLAKAKSLVEKATLLSALREKAGSFGRCRYDPEKGFRIEEYHHPLQQVYERYPRAILMEVRMLEQLLGTKVHRREIPGSKGIPSRVDYEVSTLGSP